MFFISNDVVPAEIDNNLKSKMLILPDSSNTYMELWSNIDEFGSSCQVAFQKQHLLHLTNEGKNFIQLFAQKHEFSEFSYNN